MVRRRTHWALWWLCYHQDLWDQWFHLHVPPTEGVLALCTYRYVSSRIYRCCAFNQCVLKLEAGEKFSFIAVGTFKSFWYNIKWFFISCNLLEKFIEFLATICGKSANVNPLENFNFIPEILRKNTRKKLLIAFLFFYSVKKILFKTIDDRYRINSSYSCNTLHRWFFFSQMKV